MIPKSFNNALKSIALPISLLSTSMSMEPLTTSDSSSPNCQKMRLDPNNRPDGMKQNIGHSFAAICVHYGQQWVMAGRREYDILSKIVDKDNMTIDGFLKSKIFEGQKEFHILDIGAGNFKWGQHLAERINKFDSTPEDLQVHIYSVTGESYENEKITQNGKCKLYEFDCFNYESLNDEFRKRDLSLNNKIDLAVSSYAFYYMHDPIGNLQNVLNFLKPSNGLLFIDKGLIANFKLMDESKNTIQESIIPKYLYAALIESRINVLAFPDFEAFVMKKSIEDMIFLPFAYDNVAPMTPKSPGNRRCFDNPCPPDPLYIVASKTIIPELKRVKFNGDLTIYDELKKYNPNFHD